MKDNNIIFGKNQKAVLNYFKSNSGKKSMDVVRALSGDNYSKSDRKKYYKIIKKYKDDGILIRYNQKVIFDKDYPDLNEYKRYIHPKPKYLKINEKSEKYKELEKWLSSK